MVGRFYHSIDWFVKEKLKLEESSFTLKCRIKTPAGNQPWQWEIMEWEIPLWPSSESHPQYSTSPRSYGFKGGLHMCKYRCVCGNIILCYIYIILYLWWYNVIYLGHGAADPGPYAPFHLIFLGWFSGAGEGGADGSLADFSSSLGCEGGTCRIKLSNSVGSNLSTFRDICQIGFIGRTNGPVGI